MVKEKVFFTHNGLFYNDTDHLLYVLPDKSVHKNASFWLDDSVLCQ